MKVSSGIFILFLNLLIINYGSSLKVLGILPFFSKSHFAIGSSIINSLHSAGHNITVISPFPQSNYFKERYRDVDISDLLTEYEKDNKAVNPFELVNIPKPLMMLMLYQFGAMAVDFVMTHKSVKELMDSNEMFDVCILETFNADAFVGFSDYFNCTLISYTTFGAVKWIDAMTGNESPSSYVPHPFLDYTDKMTFTERLWNKFYNILENLLFNLYHLSKQRSLYNKYFPNAKKSFDEMFKGSAIIFQNSHVTSSFPRPYLPNMIDICGIHVKPAKLLPNDLQEFIDSAEDGVIIFTMGSFINSKDFPIEKREAIVKTFGKLKQKIIWKYENDTLPDNPGNIKISSWLPQRDLIAHKNVKLFITHGGLLGTTEALTEGLPVLGIPIFGDQKMNMVKAEARGYGLHVAYDELNEETFSKALNEILSNPKYKKNAEIISKRFIDRPMTPQETVVYWTEYAVRHDGAKHLRASGNDLNFIQFHSIDVYLVLFVIFVFMLSITFTITKLLLKKLFCKSDAKQKKN
ncbi:hypothetical protein PVAND_010246 [Polypedilum vanderplanki]|uniref:UDP-glucuronosyltransferase n=1 Tax=Polypedilum vanderplanki TaxID=319348 RepID=A0A9J6CFT0_POLVA|nr:hypothetical protein PVAND_010246 [Polypedilum vanderplanki]